MFNLFTYVINFKVVGSIFFSKQEQAIDIIRIWNIIAHRANTLTIKKCCFFTSNPEIAAVYFKKIRQGD